MKNKFIRLLALAICAFLLFNSLTCLSVLADSSTDSSDDSGDSSLDWEEEWKSKIQPAYTSTAFSNVRERILGSGEIAPMVLYTVIDGYAFYGDALTGEFIFLVLADQSLTKEAILATVENDATFIPDYTAFYCTDRKEAHV